MLIIHLYSRQIEEGSSAHDERHPYRPAYFFGRHRGLHRPDRSALRRGAFRLRGSLVIALTGMLCLWSGLMEIARRCRLTEALARLMHPLTRWLFPTVPQGSPAMQAICMNLSANLLGLGNAATPLGLAAMRELQKLNPHKDSASNAMVTFVAMNTASLQLIPTTCAVLRQQAGSAAPMEILPAVWLTGLSSLAVVLLLDRLLRGKSHRPE